MKAYLTNLSHPIHDAHSNNVHCFQKNQPIILKNELFFSTEQYIYKPQHLWIAELRNELQLLNLKKDKQNHSAKIAKFYQQIARFFSFYGDHKSARDIHYSQIQIFVAWSERTKTPELLKYACHSWADLIRLDREEHHFTAAIEKINQLHSLSHRIDFIDEKCASELIQVYLDHKNYAELIQFIKKRPCQTNQFESAILSEALLIALANKGDIEAAQQWLAAMKPYSSPEIMRVFNLREYELKIKTKANIDYANIDYIESLYKQALRLLNKNYIHITKILFCLHTADILAAANLIDEAAKLSYFCLDAAQYLQDELLQAKSLFLLQRLIKDPKGQYLVKALSQQLYTTTNYVKIKEAIKKIFPENRYEENVQKESSMVPALFEELMLFSNSLLG